MPDLLDDAYGPDSKSTADISGTSWLYGPNRFAPPREPRPEPRHEARNIRGGKALPINPPAPRPSPHFQDRVAEGIALPSGAVQTGAETLPLLLRALAGRSSGEELGEKAVDLAGLLLPAVPGLKPVRAKGKHAPTRLPPLDEYVDYVKKSDPAYGTGQKPLFDWDEILRGVHEDPTFTIGGRPHDFEAPHAKHGKPSPQVQALESRPTRKRINEAADQALYEGPGGRPISVWYGPHALFKTVADKIGPEAAHDWLTQFLGYNATNSMMTGPRRAFVESALVDYNVRNDKPLNKLQPWELTGAAYPNKVGLGGDMARIGTDDPEAGISGPLAQKIRAYWLNLLGVGGIEPSYNFSSGKAERVQTPVTLDSIMAKPELFDLRGKHSDPKKRWLGPAYTTGQRVIHQEAEKSGADAVSYQSAPWQVVQANAYPDKPDYRLPHVGVVNRAIHDMAKGAGEKPEKVLDDIIFARKRPYDQGIYSVAPAAALPGLLLDQTYGTDHRD